MMLGSKHLSPTRTQTRCRSCNIDAWLGGVAHSQGGPGRAAHLSRYISSSSSSRCHRSFAEVLW